MTFIRQEKLEDKIAKDIPQISEFGFTAWDFLSAIYKFSWDKLIANKNKSFRQYILAQFNKSISNKYTSNNMSKDKQVNISRISLPIPPRPSKSVLAKSKFFKESPTIELVNKADNKHCFFLFYHYFVW